MQLIAAMKTMVLFQLASPYNLLAKLLPYVQPIYDGTTCYDLSNLPDCHRIYPNLCIGGSDCVLWKSGRFIKEAALEKDLKVNESNISCASRDTISKHCDSFSSGHFLDGRWSKKSCNFPKNYGKTFRDDLTGRHIVLIGNSMVRQVFMRLVWHSRGINEIIEHFFHVNAFYAFNSTHDFLGIGSNYSFSNCSILKPIFVADFVWDSDGNYLKNPVDLKTDLKVIGTTYFNFVASKVIGEMKRVNGPSTLFLTMPIVNWKPTRRKHIIRGNLSQINSWIESENRYHLPLSEMAETRVFGKNTADDLHFQCSFTSLSNKQVTYDMKSPASGSCNDAMNLNIVWMLIYFIRSLPCDGYLTRLLS